MHGLLERPYKINTTTIKNKIEKIKQKANTKYEYEYYEYVINTEITLIYYYIIYI